MKKVWSGVWTLWKNIFILLAMIACGAFMLACAFKLPINTDRFEISKQQIAEEKLYPRALEGEDPKANYFTTYYPDVLDGGTDTVILYTAGDNTPGGSVARAMKAYNDYFGYDYAIYWHGYVVILRPLLSLFTYHQLRILNLMVMITLMGSILVLMWRRKGWKYALGMLSSYLLLCPWALYKCFQYCPVFYIANFAILFMFVAPRVYRREGHENRLYSAFLVIGALTSFFDLLTYPLYTWGLPILMWIILDEKAMTVGRRLCQVVVSGISWIAGYGLMWVGKWLMAGRILHKDVVGEALNEVFFRAGTDSSGSGLISLFFRIQSVIMNWKHFTWWGYEIILLVWVLAGLILLLGRRFVFRNKMPAMILISCSSLVWYLALANHTEGHHLFTYRIMVILITASVFIILEGIPASLKGSIKTRVGVVEVLKGIGLTVVSMGLAFVLALGYREEVKHSNLARDAGLIPVADQIEFELTPAISAVTAFNPILVIDEGTGTLKVEIFEGDVPVQEENFEFADRNMNNQRVSWRFKPGTTYRVVLTPRAETGNVFTYVTDDPETFEEIRNTSVDGELKDGQLLMSLTYPEKSLEGWELAYLVICLGTYLSIILNCLFRSKKL